MREHMREYGPLYFMLTIMLVAVGLIVAVWKGSGWN